MATADPVSIAFVSVTSAPAGSVVDCPGIAFAPEPLLS
jgi:hypothetical protein